MLDKLHRINFAGWIKANPSIYRAVKPFAQWYVDKTGYRRIGLKFDDLLMEESESVQKAIARLTPREQQDRIWRIRRAVHQDMLHRPLPKEEWTKPEEDARYLTPLIRQVQKELDERKAYDHAAVQKD